MNALPEMIAPAWMIGCGNMGGAMVAGWRAAGIDLAGLTVIRPSGTAVQGVRTVSNAGEAGDRPKLVILAMKPHMLGEVARTLGDYLDGETTILSILAGAGCDSLRSAFPNVGAIVRAMPNLPVAIRRGVIGLTSKDAGDPLRRSISAIIAPLGYAPWMDDEDKFAVLGSVAGSGPAYVARFTDALSKAAVERGLSRELAETIALETVLGTAWMAAAQGIAMDQLARQVASPNGTTEAGLKVLDRERILEELVAVTIEAASRRGGELAGEVEARSLEARGELS